MNWSEYNPSYDLNVMTRLEDYKFAVKNYIFNRFWNAEVVESICRDLTGPESNNWSNRMLIQNQVI